MQLPFQYTYLLWLLLLLPVLAGVYFYAVYKKKKVFARIGDPELVRELTSGYNKASFLQKFLLSTAALALILLTIANLRVKAGTEKITRNGIDVMIALDVSKSMLAQDISPTRLDRAKQLLNRLMDRLDNDRIGLVVFAGKAYLQMPLTADHSAAKMYLSAATPETVPTQGTVIGDALKTCYASFNAKERKYKAVVLISDGEDHDENAVKIAGQMAQEGVVVNTVGIGSPQGANITDEKTGQPKTDNDGNIVVTKLNEQELADIAAKGNGQYQLFTSTDAVTEALYKQLSTLDQRSVTDDSLVDYNSLFRYLLGGALLLLMSELLVSEVKRKRITRMKPVITVLLLIGFSLPAISQTEQPAGNDKSARTDKESVKKGNEAYRKNDYRGAEKNYDAALKQNSEDYTALYNMGNALYKTDKKDDALGAYEKAEKNMPAGPQKSNALYNKGVILQGNNKLDECITAYEDALKNNPGNENARHNLEIALKKKKQQDQKDPRDKKDNKDQKKDQEKPDDKKDQPQQPKPQQSNISQKDAEQKLQALADKEKQLQDKFHKVNIAAPDKPEKDW